MINWTGNGRKWSWHSWGTIPAFSWREWGIPEKPQLWHLVSQPKLKLCIFLTRVFRINTTLIKNNVIMLYFWLIWKVPIYMLGREDGVNKLLSVHRICEYLQHPHFFWINQITFQCPWRQCDPMRPNCHLPINCTFLPKIWKHQIVWIHAWRNWLSQSSCREARKLPYTYENRPIFQASWHIMSNVVALCWILK